MKRLLTISMLLATATAFAGITGSPHDLSSATGSGNDYYSTNQNQICIFCHTPHFASSSQTPLWNRNDPTTTYATYWSPTMDAYDQANTPNVSGTSVLCLSCHDGVTALNSLLYEGGIGTPVMHNGDDVITGTADLVDGAEGLTNDHPVSFSYAAAAATDAELAAAGTLPDWALDGSGNVQCGSCHDVHNYGDTAEMQPFLNATKAGSALCLTCHVK